MQNIKTKNYKDHSIKTLNKSVAWMERVKDPLVYLNNKYKKESNNQETINSYGEDKIKYITNRSFDEVTHTGRKAISDIRTAHKKYKNFKKQSKNVKNTTKQTIKTTKKTIKKTEQVTKKTVKASQKAL